VNFPQSDDTFVEKKKRAMKFLGEQERLYVIDAFAGADPRYRQKIRVITSRPYHAQFMWNMLIRPTPEELANFGEPDYTIYNAGCEADVADTHTGEEKSSGTSVSLNFERKEFVILGTQYAGCMKKGVFTIINYLMPKQGILSMHASANMGPDKDTTIFFGLSGTGKTTLSSDPNRNLIGDDEHCWTDEGVFNIEGGCYAKAINLTREQEPEIYDAAKFGAVLENVNIDSQNDVDYTDTSITENTRLAYPLEFIGNAELPSVGGHPKNVIMLTCDAFGVLPPVSRLTKEQAMYHYIAGYTAKVAGTEVGVTDPTVTFSACFGAPFLVWHPTKYAELLAEQMDKFQTDTWLVNTGWAGGAYGVGSRMKLKYTRAVIDAIHSGELAAADFETMDVFNFEVPKSCSGVPTEMLMPSRAWSDQVAYKQTVDKLATLFNNNFEDYKDNASADIINAGPQL